MLLKVLSKKFSKSREGKDLVRVISQLGERLFQEEKYTKSLKKNSSMGSFAHDVEGRRGAESCFTLGENWRGGEMGGEEHRGTSPKIQSLCMLKRGRGKMEKRDKLGGVITICLRFINDFSKQKESWGGEEGIPAAYTGLSPN